MIRHISYSHLDILSPLSTMADMRIPEWRKLPVSLKELCIDTTLRCGQSFRWRKMDEEWYSSPPGFDIDSGGVREPCSLRLTESTIRMCAHFPNV